MKGIIKENNLEASDITSDSQSSDDESDPFYLKP
jgi:hypothetical protein